MKFGINLYPFYRFSDIASITTFVQRAEQLGYAYVEIPEHAAFPAEYEPAMGSLWYDAMVLGTHLVSRTRSMRVGFGILILPQHNPFYLAKQLSTLDLLSGGRTFLGVGVGWLEGEMSLQGGDFSHRGARTNEYLKALRALWSPDPCSYQGRHISFRDVISNPKPLNPKGMPIYIGGGVAASVSRAVELGDGWIPMGATFEDFRVGLERLKQGLAERGRSVETFTISKGIPFYGHNPHAQEHVRAAGVTDATNLGGDVGKALEYVYAYQGIGVTQMTLSVSALGKDPYASLEDFAANVMAKV